ncbi:MAG: hypothetical protein EBX40_01330 [Gammaproteobacteria bacterium]|nr:hypothetical protein [Gammaproteobacteria bacterium]
MSEANSALSKNINIGTLKSANTVDFKIWESPNVIVIPLALNTRGIPSALFEDDAGIAHS